MKATELNARNHFHNHVYPSPFHAGQEKANTMKEWSRWADYLSVPAYFDASLEYFAARNSCAVFDLTPMIKHRVSGPDALAYLNRLVTRDVSKIKPGRVGYAVWCTDEGQVIDDGTIFHLSEGVYRVCSQERQIDWFLTCALGFDVAVVEETHEIAGLAFQGPTSCAVLKKLGLQGVEHITPFGLQKFPFAGTELMVSRTGYTGDLGYELWIDPDHAMALWDGVFEAGQHHGIWAMGSQALDMLRIEAGFILAGVDFMPALHAVRPTHTRSPFELSLGWLVDFKKPVFNGRRALLAEKERGSRYTLVKLDIEGNKVARDSYVYTRDRKYAGTVT
ncbi:MAG: aminomethyltransferase family protein, partial [Lysobacterales bacterium]